MDEEVKKDQLLTSEANAPLESVTFDPSDPGIDLMAFDVGSPAIPNSVAEAMLRTIRDMIDQHLTVKAIRIDPQSGRPIWGPCKRCGYAWSGHRSFIEPDQCARCHSRNWNKAARSYSRRHTAKIIPKAPPKVTVTPSGDMTANFKLPDNVIPPSVSPGGVVLPPPPPPLPLIITPPPIVLSHEAPSVAEYTASKIANERTTVDEAVKLVKTAQPTTVGDQIREFISTHEPPTLSKSENVTDVFFKPTEDAKKAFFSEPIDYGRRIVPVDDGTPPPTPVPDEKVIVNTANLDAVMAKLNK